MPRLVRFATACIVSGRSRWRKRVPPIPSPRLTGYRNKMDFTFGPRAWAPEGPPETPLSPALGLHVPGRFDAVFELEECRLPGGRAVTALRIVREYARSHGLAGYRSRADEGLLRHLIVREGKNTGDLLLGLVTRTAEPERPGLADALAEQIQGLTGVVRIVNSRRATIAARRTDRPPLRTRHISRAASSSRLRTRSAIVLPDQHLGRRSARHGVASKR